MEEYDFLMTMPKGWSAPASRINNEGKKRALIISISSYADNCLPPLDFCEKNGKEMYSLLKTLGYKNIK
jgi:hypothetical protein